MLRMCQLNYHISDLDQIKLPLRIPKRGRPMGADQTVIGLPRKRHKTAALPSPYAKRNDKHRCE